jgi:hypothetical protein
VSKARLVAQILSKRFLAEGSIAVMPQQRMGSDADGMHLASSKHKPDLWPQTAPFSGLAVQAVGHGVGPEGPVVVIYISKGRAVKGLPEEMDGVPIVVRSAKLISVSPERASKVTGEKKVYLRNKRIACGSSCASAGGQAGTLGSLVAKEDKEGLFLMSANHVLAGCNQFPPGMHILSPAPGDDKPGGTPPTALAELADVLPMYSGYPDHVPACEEDVALGKLTNADLVSSWQGDDAEGYDTPTETVDPQMGMRVKKVGRSTGMTVATVDVEVSDPYPIPCQAKGFKGWIWFKNYWYLHGDETPFALPGDSGSLVVTEDGKAAVGLLFSTSANGALGHMIPIRHVLKRLKASLVNGHGI